MVSSRLRSPRSRRCRSVHPDQPATLENRAAFMRGPDHNRGGQSSVAATEFPGGRSPDRLDSLAARVASRVIEAITCTWMRVVSSRSDGHAVVWLSRSVVRQDFSRDY